MRHFPIHRSLLYVAIASMLAAPVVEAQLVQGQRFRIRQGNKLIADAIYAGSDSARFALMQNGSDTVAIPFAGDYSVQRFMGKEGGGWRTVRKGTAIGAALGAVFVAVGIGESIVNPVHDEPGLGVVLGSLAAAFSTSVGFVVGAIAGRPHDVWVPVSFVPGPTVHATPVTPSG